MPHLSILRGGSWEWGESDWSGVPWTVVTVLETQVSESRPGAPGLVLGEELGRGEGLGAPPLDFERWVL